MTEFAEGCYIDADRKLRNADGSYDEHSRWVDEKGYIRTADGDFDQYAFIDAQGGVHDGNGMDSGAKLGVPGDWSVLLAASQNPVKWNEGTPDVLSTTQGTSPSEEAMTAFKAGIVHSAPAKDAMGNPLTWAGSSDPNEVLHERALNSSYAGEDTSAAVFPDGTLRRTRQPDDPNWTTEYDRDETESVTATQLGADHLLRDETGTVLNGTFGYVVDPATGTIYTFDQSEGYVSQGGDWLPLAGLPRDKMAALIREALDHGESVSSVHHSTPLAGGGVAGAGQLTVEQGVITAINDESGHYKPEGEYLWQTVAWLHAQGMPVADISVTQIAKGQEAKLVLEGWQLMQTGGNQTQARLKGEVNTEIRRRGFQQTQEAQANAIVPGSPADLHRQRFGCVNFQPDDTNTYCMGCDNDLN
jgi:hypothetical protein